MTGKHWKLTWLIGIVLFAVGEIGAAFNKGNGSEWDTFSEFWKKLPRVVKDVGIFTAGAVFSHLIEWRIRDEVTITNSTLNSTLNIEMETNCNESKS